MTTACLPWKIRTSDAGVEDSMERALEGCEYEWEILTPFLCPPPHHLAKTAAFHKYRDGKVCPFSRRI